MSLPTRATAHLLAVLPPPLVVAAGLGVVAAGLAQWVRTSHLVRRGGGAGGRACRPRQVVPPVPPRAPPGDGAPIPAGSLVFVRPMAAPPPRSLIPPPGLPNHPPFGVGLGWVVTTILRS